jgi:hypothetical protein
MILNKSYSKFTLPLLNSLHLSHNFDYAVYVDALCERALELPCSATMHLDNVPERLKGQYKTVNENRGCRLWIGMLWMFLMVGFWCFGRRNLWLKYGYIGAINADPQGPSKNQNQTKKAPISKRLQHFPQLRPMRRLPFMLTPLSRPFQCVVNLGY